MHSLSEHSTEDCEGAQLIFTADTEMAIAFPRRHPQSIHMQNPFISSLVLRDASAYKGI